MQDVSRITYHVSRIAYHVSRITYHVSRSAQHVSRITILLLAFVLLGFTYSATTPVFEAPDEVWHYNYIRYVAEGHDLPSLQDNEHGAYQEAAQPPLYYLVAGLITAPVPDDDKREVTWPNPGFGYHAPGTVNDNKNMLVHTDREGWPWRGFTLALHLARLVSLAFGALAVFATWGLAREVLPGRPGLAVAAASVVAFTPQFAFMSGVASNDSASAALSTAALWSIASLLHREGPRQPTARRVALTGALIGLAWLTKTSTLLLLPLAMLSITLGYCRTERSNHESRVTHHVSRFTPSTSPRASSHVSRFTFYVSRITQHVSRITFHASRITLRNLAILTGTTLLVGGWWYARSLALYGDALGLSSHVNTPWGRSQPVSLVAVLPELPQVYRSFWAAFGWGGIEAPARVYLLISALVLASMIGWLLVAGSWLLVAACRLPVVRRRTPASASFVVGRLRPRRSSLFVILLWCLSILAALLRWMMQIEAPHGRLLLPAIGAWAVLLVVGWAAWGRRAGRALILSGLGFLGALSLLSPFVLIRPALVPPPLLTEAQVRARVNASSMVYGGVAELVGWQLARTTARAGDVVPVTLCWRALQPMSSDYSVFVHFLGKDNLVVGARDTWPGLGRFPTRLWPPGRPFCDVVRVRVKPWAPAPAVYAVEVGLYDVQGDERLEVKRPGFPQGVGLPIVGQLILRGAPPPAPQHTVSYNLGDGMAFIGYTLVSGDRKTAQVRAGQPFSLTLYWQAQTDARRDYAVFVHVLDEARQIAAQHDSPPREGEYPTSVWTRDEIVADTHAFILPPGLYTLNMGMYYKPDGTRLPVYGPDGPVQNDAIPLLTLQVTQ